MTNKDIIIETAERIVIDYANFSGREELHRAEFREAVIQHLISLLLADREKAIAEMSKLKEQVAPFGHNTAIRACIDILKRK